ncbi:hypothetical protein [Vibrio crassostreae]|uniref:hypothetical protein n=1 Tax=Vibrio crassostreae TaxID=246167 RepID=UPI001B30F313|nr:hypothetical protein [Vibrio crassostreae]
MILVNLSELNDNNGCISGDLILRGRAKADTMHNGKLAHFHLGESLTSYPDDAVIFNEEADESQVTAIHYNWKTIRYATRHLYGALVNNSPMYDHWDGEKIFDLIKVLQGGAKQRELNKLEELIRYRPIALRSPRLTKSVLQKYRCGEEASKVYHFYQDNSGYALVAIPDVKFAFEYMTDTQAKYRHELAGYYLCSQENLPKLLSVSRDRRDHYNAIEMTGKDTYLVDGIEVQKVTMDFSAGDSCITPKALSSSIPKNEYGYTAAQVKHAMEWICNEYYTGTRSISYISGMSLSQLSKFVDIAIRDELIESLEISKDDEFWALRTEPFQCTVKGNALCMKKGNKRMTKTALNKQKDTIVARYLEAQKHKDEMVLVPSVLGYFGSAIKENAKDHGDLDTFYVALLSVEANKSIQDYLEDRPRADPALVYRNALNTAYEDGQYPLKAPSVDMYSSLRNYANKVACTFLKRRSKLISVHDLSEVMSINAPFEVHYIGSNKLDEPITDYEVLKARLLEEFDFDTPIAGSRIA